GARQAAQGPLEGLLADGRADLRELAGRLDRGAEKLDARRRRGIIRDRVAGRRRSLGPARRGGLGLAAATRPRGGPRLPGAGRLVSARAARPGDLRARLARARSLRRVALRAAARRPRARQARHHVTLGRLLVLGHADMIAHARSPARAGPRLLAKSEHRPLMNRVRRAET